MNVQQLRPVSEQPKAERPPFFKLLDRIFDPKQAVEAQARHEDALMILVGVCGKDEAERRHRQLMEAL